MMKYHPQAGAAWAQARNGVFVTDKSFYDESGGIFQPSPHYEEMFGQVEK